MTNNNYQKPSRWDKYFHTICLAVGSNSRCLSRQIGAILVRDKSIISTGYNGPPRGVPHCSNRYKLDPLIIHEMEVKRISDYNSETCPRQTLGYKSGQGLHLCIASHAEVNCINNAARNGISTFGATIYMTCGVPCKDCLGELINAGIVEIVCSSDNLFYDDASSFLIKHSSIIIRNFG